MNKKKLHGELYWTVHGKSIDMHQKVGTPLSDLQRFGHELISSMSDFIEQGNNDGMLVANGLRKSLHSLKATHYSISYTLWNIKCWKLLRKFPRMAYIVRYYHAVGVFYVMV